MKKFVLANPGDVLNEVYDLQRPMEHWIRNITTSLDPYMNGGNGTLGAVFNLQRRFEMPVLSHHEADREIGPFHHFVAGLGALPRMSPKDSPLGRIFAANTMGTLFFDSPEKQAREFFLREFKRQNVVDAAGLIVPHKRTSSVIFFTARQRELAPVPERAKKRWREFQHHVAAVYDLRERLESRNFEEQDAVWFDTAGSCIEAGPATDPEVRKRLRAAVLQYENSRTGRTQSHRVELEQYWESVMSGRWIILDRFDTDGRRYLIALPVSEAGDALRGLSPREREVLDLVGDGLSNKAIGFELGISTTSVSTHLYNIYRKLGIEDRAAVVRLVRTVRQREGVRLSA